MTPRSVIRSLFALAVAATASAAALAGDVLDDYQKKYTKTALISDREVLIKALVATGKPEAVKALMYCVGVSKASIEDARENVEKIRPKVDAARAKFDGKLKAYMEEQRKAGNPNPAGFPNWPEHDEYMKYEAEAVQAEKAVFAEIMLRDQGLDGCGALVAKLPAPAQAAVRADWTKNRLAVKDWQTRAECYESLGHTPTDWALETLLGAVSEKESDPRALTSAIDGLSGKDAAKTVPALAARLEDVRWTVRVAVVAALENTPSKEGIDAIVKRMVKEDGRLLADCARALQSLTGQDIQANPEAWRIWWAANREKWKGKPEQKGATPFGGLDDPKTTTADDPSKRTGFFGLKIESRRVVFVIDTSGSMNEPMSDKGAKQTKADAARRELKQAIVSLEDGAVFDIVTFASSVRVWKTEMQTADVKTRREAQDFVDAMDFVGATGTYDALETAFMLGDVGKGKKRESDPTGDARVDTIVLLSDGKPTAGRQTDPDAIRRAVKDWNKARRIVIHSVALGVDKKDGADPKFMAGLAEDSGGVYVAK